MPTIGIVDTLPQLEQTSGRIVVMTDSSCLDSASPSMTKCFWLIEKIVKIASGEIKSDQTLMIEKYRLPNDYESNERPHFMILEEINMEQLSKSIYK